MFASCLELLPFQILYAIGFFSNNREVIRNSKEASRLVFLVQGRRPPNGGSVREEVLTSSGL